MSSVIKKIKFRLFPAEFGDCVNDHVPSPQPPPRHVHISVKLVVHTTGAKHVGYIKLERDQRPDDQVLGSYVKEFEGQRSLK